MQSVLVDRQVGVWWSESLGASCKWPMMTDPEVIDSWPLLLWPFLWGRGVVHKMLPADFWQFDSRQESCSSAGLVKVLAEWLRPRVAGRTYWVHAQLQGGGGHYIAQYFLAQYWGWRKGFHLGLLWGCLLGSDVDLHYEEVLQVQRRDLQGTAIMTPPASLTPLNGHCAPQFYPRTFPSTHRLARWGGLGWQTGRVGNCENKR